MLKLVLSMPVRSCVPVCMCVCWHTCISVCSNVSVLDPWKSSAYVSEYAWFVQHLMPGIFRIQCKSRDLITDLEQQSLAAKERDGPVVHNEYLLSRLEIGGSRSFLLFCQILKDLGPTFDQKRHGLEAVVHQSYDRYH